ncbi:MAG: tRNA (adenosine(37)-N6)-threonylcarbamoyltransferase complex ATPase subunit type 1 TsaE [Thermoanaerobaculia bacterium]
MTTPEAAPGEGIPPKEIASSGEAATEAFGRRLGRVLRAEDVVYLRGRLGAGKTALARGVAVGRGAQARQVASPTFALLHEYADPDGRIVLRHLDLYRLEDSGRDLEVLGLPGSVEGAPVLVEWPNRTISGLLPPTIEVTIEAGAGEERHISWTRSGR